jgi:hypothetical protein
MAWSVPRTWAVSDDITAARLQAISDDLNVLGNPPLAIKTATESVTSSTTLQDDDELTVTVEASTLYRFEMVLLYDGNQSGDLRFAFVAPSGTVQGAVHRLVTGATLAAASELSMGGGDLTTAVAAGTLGTGTTTALYAFGIAAIGVTGGSLKLQWAQNTSSASATRVLANSYLLTQRVGAN